MRTLILIAVAATALTLGACSREDATQVKEGVQAAAGEVKQAASDIKNDPDVKEAGTALKEATKDAGAELKAAGGELKDAAKDLGADAKKAGKELGDEIDGDKTTS